MKQNELRYFTIEGAYGGSQDWFGDFWMRIGGCAAVTACDCSIYLTLFHGKKLYPFDASHLTKADYVRFGMMMKPYLRPRSGGIDRLSIYLDGFGAFLADRQEAGVRMTGIPGESDAEEAADMLRAQIDSGFPAAMLTLRHAAPEMRDYIWHWYLLTGWRESDDGQLFVKTVTYGMWKWIDFSVLWNTGKTPKGGMVLFQLDGSNTAGSEEEAPGGPSA